MQPLLFAHSWLLAQSSAPAVGAGPLGHGFIYTILIGLVIGIVAKFLTPGRDPGGCIITSLIGIAGAMIASFIGRAIGHYGPGDTPGFIASVIGAIILLAVYHLVIRKKSS